MFCSKCGALLVFREDRKVCPRCEAHVEAKTRDSTYIEDFFPFSNPRPGQREMLHDVAKAIDEGMHLIAHAPTGIGKTAAALVPAIMKSVNEDYRVLFLTSRQSHHRIAVETIRSVAKKTGRKIVAVDFIAKQHMCPRPESRFNSWVFNAFCMHQVHRMRCPFYLRESFQAVAAVENGILHVHELKKICADLGVCPYKVAMDAGARSHIIVCDYNYLFSDMAEKVMERLEIDLSRSVAIVDESHNLPDRIRSNMETQLTESMIKEAKVELRRENDLLRPMEAIHSWFKSVMDEVPEDGDIVLDRSGLVDALERSFMERIDMTMDLQALLTRLEEAAANVAEGKERVATARIYAFLSTWFSEVKSMIRYAERRQVDRVACYLLDPSIISGPVFHRLHASVLMSGTLHPQEMYAHILGIEQERYRAHTYPSPFPQENRLIITVTSVTTRYIERNEVMYRNYADLILEIAKRVPGNMAVYFPSYELMSCIAGMMTGRLEGTILMEERGMVKWEKERLYEEVLLPRNERTILLGVMGGSLSEGMDFKDNALRAVVIVGIPLAPPSVLVDSLRSYYDNKFGKGKGYYYGYVYPAMNKVIQAAGRMIRSERDRGVVVLMDRRFEEPRYKRCFPPSFVHLTARNPLALIEGFFTGWR